MPEPRRLSKTDFGIAALLVLYCLFVSYLQARAKTFWYDELFTYYVTKLPSMAKVWDALMVGVDNNPPFYYVATRALFPWTQNEELGIRLPSMLGFAMMSATYFLFVSRRLNTACGLLAVVLSWTCCFHFSHEGRPYGMIFGFFGLALLAWQSAANGANSRRVLSLLGLGIGILGFLQSHCYAVLLLIPLTGGELVRTLVNRKIDWPVWITLTISSSSALVYLPLLRAAREMMANHPGRPSFGAAIGLWRDQVDSLFIPFIVLIVALVFCAFVGGQRVWTDARERLSKAIPIHELAAMVLLLLLPFFGVVLAKVANSAFTGRYATAACLGLVFFPAFLLFAFDTRKIAWLTAIAITLWVMGAHARLPPPRSLDGHISRLTELAKTPGPPIAITSGFLYFELTHYVKPELGDRIIYLNDPEGAAINPGSRIFEWGFPRMRQWFNPRLITRTYSSFVKENPTFLVYDPRSADYTWLKSQLIVDGHSVQIADERDGNQTLRVTTKSK